MLRRLKGRFGFDRWRGLFGLGDLGTAVGSGPVAKQGTNQTLLIAFSVVGGNNLQTDNLGVHRMAKHFLGSETDDKKEEEKRKQGGYLVQ